MTDPSYQLLEQVFVLYLFVFYANLVSTCLMKTILFAFIEHIIGTTFM